MSTQGLKFAIIGNECKRQETQRNTDSIIKFLDAHNATALLDPDDLSDVDYVISMGGDGTFLKAAGRVGNLEIPIIGINMGRLGFLADVLPNEIEHTLTKVLNHDYEIEDHTVIQIIADGFPVQSNPYALNDIAVLKRDSASMISIRTYINGDFLINYQADGLIISTPTGSTAYNLSNGGPIIVPRSSSLCITPVAPHSLNIRPIVITDTSEIVLDVESRSHNYLVAVDGRSEKMAVGMRLTIRKAPYVVKFLKQKNLRYFSTLQEKLMWGADTRQ